MNNILSLLNTHVQLSLVFKIVVLIILFLYLIYTFILIAQIKELSNIVYVYAKQASRILYLFSIFYMLAALSLFLIALVIL